MINVYRRGILAAIAGCFGVAAVSFAYYFWIADGHHLPEIAWAGTIFCAIVIISAMVYILCKSLNRSLYAYKNIYLFGWIIFASFFVVVFSAELIPYLGENEASFGTIFESLYNLPRYFTISALIVLTVICLMLAISNIALIRHEGFCVQNVLSIVLAAFYLGGTFVVYFILHLIIDSHILTDLPFGVAITVFIYFCLLAVLCYFECLFAGIAIMGWKSARQIPKYDRDYIIILGCSIDKRGGLRPLLKGRVNRAIRFAWDQEIATGKPLKYVPSGGKGSDEIMSEGSAMELYLLSRGAESYEVYPEKESTNTDENMRFSKKIIDELKPDAKVAFATTNYHMLRSGIIARNAGLDAEGIAGDTKWYFWPNGFVREFFAILLMRVKQHLISIALLAALCVGITILAYIGSNLL